MQDQQVVLPFSRELGKPFCNGVHKAEPPLFRKLQDCRSSSENLGQRGQVENIINSHRTGVSGARGAAIGLLKEDFSAVADQDDPTGDKSA